MACSEMVIIDELSIIFVEGEGIQHFDPHLAHGQRVYLSTAT